jgi:UDP-N-acetylmuramyl pentapeptide phosphotransferase/UDP-N-acetylglucosamine-1-phosphate transferase
MQGLLVLMAIAIGAGITALIIPPVVRVAKSKHLFDFIEERKIHTQKIPPMGGVGIFLGVMIATVIFTKGKPFPEMIYIFTSALIIFFTGLKDDLVSISALKKTVVELIAIVILIWLGDIRITSFHGILGIHEISYSLSFAFTLFLFLALINSYNLIDGVDGLSSGLGMMVTSAFGVWFLLTGNEVYSIFAFAVFGSLLAFFMFNVYGDGNKVFLGDNGSLVLGLFISIFCIEFIESVNLPGSFLTNQALPAIAFSLVCLPLMDTLRVMLIRIFRGVSPFHPDNNHIHHKILIFTKKHLIITLILIGANLSILIVAVLLNYLIQDATIQFIIVFIYGFLLSLLPFAFLKFRIIKTNHS